MKVKDFAEVFSGYIEVCKMQPIMSLPPVTRVLYHWRQ